VIGQRDFYSTLPQGPSQTTSNLSTGLFAPVGLTVDGRGNLYVIDAANNRVLCYPTPFTQTGDLIPVDLVIGQRSVSGAGMYDYPSNFGGASAAGGPGPDRQLTIANGLVPTIAVK
jgi:hypothetical protein